MSKPIPAKTRQPVVSTIIRNIVYAILLCAIVWGWAWADNPAALLPVTVWEESFQTVWNEEHVTEYDGWSKNGNSAWYYFLAYALDGNTAMYESTCTADYLDRALYYINNIVADAQVSATMPTSQYQDNYQGWVAHDPEDGALGEVSLYESYFWRYVTRVLRVIRQTPRLYDDALYRQQYDQLLAFTETHLFEKWYTRDPTNIYRSRTHMAATWAYIALDLWLITEDATRKALYWEVVTKINTDLSPYHPSSLRNQIIANPRDVSAYFWNDEWGSYDRPGQDTSHGNNVIAYMVEAHDQEIYWDDADVTGLSNLVTKVLWNGDAINPTFGAYFDGSSRGEGFFQSDGFLKLGRYDPNIQQIYEQYTGQDKYLTQFYGNGALNARRLSAGVTSCIVPTTATPSAVSPTDVVSPTVTTTATQSATMVPAPCLCQTRLFLPMVGK